jgi:hypothetical protein
VGSYPLAGWTFIIFLATVPLADVPHLHIPEIPFLTVNKLVFLFLLAAWLPNRLRQGIHWFANSHIQVQNQPGSPELSGSCGMSLPFYH